MYSSIWGLKWNKMFVCCDTKRTCLNFFISVFPLPDWRRWRGGGHRERNAADQCGKSGQKIWTLLSHLPSNRHPPTFYEKLKLTTTKIKFVQKKKILNRKCGNTLDTTSERPKVALPCNTWEEEIYYLAFIKLHGNSLRFY